MEPESSVFNVTWPNGSLSHLFNQLSQQRLKMKFTQFPILVNVCTTGHKLQGQTLIALVVAKWSALKNWSYVTMSRVTKRIGFFSTAPINRNADYSIDEDLKLMLDNFKARSPTPHNLW